MSVRQMSLAFQHSKSAHAERLVLLSLANHAHDDGTLAYPSIATIAREAALGESTVRLALKGLIGRGEIIETGAGPKGTRCFSITIPTPSESEAPQDLSPPQDLAAPPSESEGGGAQNLADPPAESAPEPSVKPSPESSITHPPRVREVGNEVVAILATASTLTAPSLEGVCIHIAANEDRDAIAAAKSVVAAATDPEWRTKSATASFGYLLPRAPFRRSEPETTYGFVDRINAKRRAQEAAARDRREHRSTGHQAGMDQARRFGEMLREAEEMEAAAAEATESTAVELPF